ncbi:MULTISPECIES: cysteine dioxygenase family protein [Streptomyces]|uniref:Cysteine dioxygenase n=1 Tax=Streptomyces katrae TaxID=68223 RepID=A0A0F4K0U5_9ACTN|nr:cysteine dioxygenase family protein [Streptomyces katrae]KJY39548.1 cysteine dioxygenase [Streptomyces katrae]MCF3178446.1 cysteine dioxygenase family protein [Streptomyces polychromogenes]
MTTTTPARTTTRMAALVSEIRTVVDRGLAPDLTAYLVGERLAPHLGASDLLTAEQQEGDPENYRQHVLHAEPDGSFSVVALVWMPGQETCIHDHVSWCVAGVHQGEESERRYRLAPGTDAARLVATEDVVNAQGEVCGFAPPGDIHRVRNSCTSTAISIHVYGADVSRLGSSIRRVYTLPVD